MGVASPDCCTGIKEDGNHASLYCSGHCAISVMNIVIFMWCCTHVVNSDEYHLLKWVSPTPLSQHTEWVILQSISACGILLAFRTKLLI